MREKRQVKSILVTGGLGFIGFNALQLWKKIDPSLSLTVIDAETYAAQFMLGEKLRWCKENGVAVIKGNIVDTSLVDATITSNGIDSIVNFAAESHVDNSIKRPNVFFETNVLGTVSLLNVAKKHNLRFHQISTDEVYGVTNPNSWDDETQYGNEMRRPEDMPLDPSSPYSSSKASADLIALSYFKTFGTAVTVSRCTNNFGKFQHSEKLIPTIITKALNDQKIPIYGKGTQRRHWIHVDEHNRAILDILVNGELGKVFNIAPSDKNYKTNMQIVKMILKHLGKDPATLIEHVKDRAAHDVSYYLCSSNYASKRQLKKDLNATVDWYASLHTNEDSSTVSLQEDNGDLK